MCVCVWLTRSILDTHLSYFPYTREQDDTLLGVSVAR